MYGPSWRPSFRPLGRGSPDSLSRGNEFTPGPLDLRQPGVPEFVWHRDMTPPTLSHRARNRRMHDALRVKGRSQLCWDCTQWQDTVADFVCNGGISRSGTLFGYIESVALPFQHALRRAITNWTVRLRSGCAASTIPIRLPGLLRGEAKGLLKLMGNVRASPKRIPMREVARGRAPGTERGGDGAGIWSSGATGIRASRTNRPETLSRAGRTRAGTGRSS